VSGIGVIDVFTGVHFDFQAQSWRLYFKISVARQLIMLLINVKCSQCCPPLLIPDIQMNCCRNWLLGRHHRALSG